MRQRGSKKQPVEIALIGNRRDVLRARSAGTIDQVTGDQRHAGADNKGDAGRNPKQPPPMQRWNSDQPEKGKSGEQSRSKFENAEATEINHETEDAGKASTLGVTEPRRIYFHHSRRAEGLHVATDSANQDKQPK